MSKTKLVRMDKEVERYNGRKIYKKTFKDK